MPLDSPAALSGYWLLCQRQRKPEAGPVRADIVDADMPLVGLDNRAHDGQAQAGAAGGGGRGAGAVEPVKNVGTVLRINAPAMVFDADQHRIAAHHGVDEQLVA